MKKWMIFRRESDGAYFLFNGEGCIRVSSAAEIDKTTDGKLLWSSKWHHDYGELPREEILILEDTLNRPRKAIFEIKDRGRYQVVARGEFKGL